MSAEVAPQGIAQDYVTLLFGYMFAPVYFVFLSLLMTALTAKVIAMALLGYQVIPAILSYLGLICSLLFAVC